MTTSATTSTAATASIAVPAAASSATSHLGAPVTGSMDARFGSANSEWGFIISASQTASGFPGTSAFAHDLLPGKGALSGWPDRLLHHARHLPPDARTWR